eukprot:TRINITY_DN4574_c0_g2_i1.p1 TRINITY_DN4574_c0_g2~~TRINITY_DN4574_c0_g2_i1.p1  ORF type:complete len:1075 (+),score=161.95 TRINITY_DN4574_c0_g2_i1:852-4076(+)
MAEPELYGAAPPMQPLPLPDLAKMKLYRAKINEEYRWISPCVKKDDTVVMIAQAYDASIWEVEFDPDSGSYKHRKLFFVPEEDDEEFNGRNYFVPGSATSLPVLRSAASYSADGGIVVVDHGADYLYRFYGAQASPDVSTVWARDPHNRLQDEDSDEQAAPLDVKFVNNGLVVVSPDRRVTFVDAATGLSRSVANPEAYSIECVYATDSSLFAIARDEETLVFLHTPFVKLEWDRVGTGSVVGHPGRIKSFAVTETFEFFVVFERSIVLCRPENDPTEEGALSSLAVERTHSVAMIPQLNGTRVFLLQEGILFYLDLEGVRVLKPAGFSSSSSKLLAEVVTQHFTTLEGHLYQDGNPISKTDAPNVAKILSRDSKKALIAALCGASEPLTRCSPLALAEAMIAASILFNDTLVAGTLYNACRMRTVLVKEHMKDTGMASMEASPAAVGCLARVAMLLLFLAPEELNELDQEVLQMLRAAFLMSNSVFNRSMAELPNVKRPQNSGPEVTKFWMSHSDYEVDPTLASAAFMCLSRLMAAISSGIPPAKKEAPPLNGVYETVKLATEAVINVATDPDRADSTLIFGKASAPFEHELTCSFWKITQGVVNGPTSHSPILDVGNEWFSTALAYVLTNLPPLSLDAIVDVISLAKLLSPEQTATLSFYSQRRVQRDLPDKDAEACLPLLITMATIKNSPSADPLIQEFTRKVSPAVTKQFHDFAEADSVLLRAIRNLKTPVFNLDVFGTNQADAEKLIAPFVRLSELTVAVLCSERSLEQKIEALFSFRLNTAHLEMFLGYDGLVKACSILGIKPHQLLQLGEILIGAEKDQDQRRASKVLDILFDVVNGTTVDRWIREVNPVQSAQPSPAARSPQQSPGQVPRFSPGSPYREAAPVPAIASSSNVAPAAVPPAHPMPMIGIHQERNNASESELVLARRIFDQHLAAWKAPLEVSVWEENSGIRYPNIDDLFAKANRYAFSFEYTSYLKTAAASSSLRSPQPLPQGKSLPARLQAIALQEFKLELEILQASKIPKDPLHKEELIKYIQDRLTPIVGHGALAKLVSRTFAPRAGKTDPSHK